VTGTPEKRVNKAKTRVFISYSRKDMAFADRLDAALKARGFDVLIDREGIYAFEDWWKRIEALIGSADSVVFVLSPDAVKSDVALKEFGYAASLNKRFAPIVCRRLENSDVPDALRRLNFIFFDEPEHFEARADRLADALETDINWIRQHTEYGEAERRWSSAGRPNGMLLQSPTLDLAEYWLTSRPRNAPEPTQEIRTYVIASRKRARASQRIWRGILASMFTLLVSIIAGLVGWINQDYLKTQWRWWTVTRPYMIAQIRPHVLTVAQEQSLKPKQLFKECAQDCPEMVVVPAGQFMMGAWPSDNGRTTGEIPQHKVTIAKAFAVSKYQLTFAEWDACADYGDCNRNVSDGNFGRGRQPVANVTWNDAQQYVAWLSKMTGKQYRLLTEAEYEYAARAGTTTVYPWGDVIGKNNADCNGCGSQWDNKKPAPVGSFAANDFGLHDMLGNVWEWVQDCLHSNYDGAPDDGSAWLEGGDCKIRVVRGASFIDPPVLLRSALRLKSPVDNRSGNLGFRVAQTLDLP
jgi:formylglycine-generating enzyme required for sulfatase activity